MDGREEILNDSPPGRAKDREKGLTMLNLDTVNWRKDRITERYVEDHKEDLQHPEEMTPGDLGTAVTYCLDFDNPFSLEIMRRSGHLEKFKMALNPKERRQIFDRACNYHGFKIM